MIILLSRPKMIGNIKVYVWVHLSVIANVAWVLMKKKSPSIVFYQIFTPTRHGIAMGIQILSSLYMRMPTRIESTINAGTSTVYEYKKSRGERLIFCSLP